METFCLWWLLLQQLLISVYTTDLEVTPTGTTIRILGGMNVFIRNCEYNGTSDHFSYLDWTRNGDVAKSGQVKARSDQLLITAVKSNQGEYRCRVIFANGSIGETISAGDLLVYDPASAIVAPTLQQVVAGESIQLMCRTSITKTSELWMTSSFSHHSGIIERATLADQGVYSCKILETIMGSIIYTIKITLEVIVPPLITHITPTRETFGNEPVTFIVHFLSSFNYSTKVTWQRDNALIPPDRFQVNYTNKSGGTTSLMFTELRRADMGRYRVQIENSLAAIPVERRSAFKEFVVKSKVLPARPSAPTFVRVNSTRTQVAWKVSNITSDSVPDSLLLVIKNHPDSPISLNSSTRQFLLRTEPGMNYTIAIYAYNHDGRAASRESLLSIAFSAPAITGFIAVRVNTTAFKITVTLLYTGAGAQGHVSVSNIMFREDGNRSWFQFSQDVELIRKSDSGMDWYALLVHKQFSTLGDVEFSLNVQNNVASDVGARLTVVGMAVVPGQPVIVSGNPTSPNSLTIQARLSTTGTSPILSLNITLSAIGHITSVLMETNDLVAGGLVAIEVGDLSPDTSYTVVLYAVNIAGRSQDSVQRMFSTAQQGSPFSVWKIVLVVSCCVMVALIVLLLVCFIRCYKVKKTASVPRSPNIFRPDSMRATGSAGSVDLFHNSTSCSFIYNNSTSEFPLNPPPDGLNTPRSPTLMSCSEHHIGSSNSSVKSRSYAGSFSPSVSSKPSSKSFMIRHSPVPPLSRAEIFQSMSALENYDHSPTLPPHCATDV